MKVKIGKYKPDNCGRDIKVKISRDDLISLDSTLAIVILPALKKYKEIASKVIVIEGEFGEALDAMIEAFELIESGEHFNHDPEIDIKIQKGLDAFAKHYLGLWY